MDCIDNVYFDNRLNTELVTYALTGMLHAKNCDKPYITFLLPAEGGQYFSPLEYTVPVPPAIEWPYKSYGEFACDVVVTMDANSLEVVSLDDVRPNPSLEGGF